MRFAILLSVLLLCGISGLQAQIQYTIQIERPEGISDAEIKSLFDEYPDIHNVQVGGNRLVMTVPDREDYSIRTIRDILAQKKVAAVDLEIAPGRIPVAGKKSLETTKFKVYGECGMCKDRIERAARSVNGVVMANWNAESQELMLKYLPGKTDKTEIQKAVTAVGHDTDSLRATDESYDQLHTCCKYERPAPARKN